MSFKFDEAKRQALSDLSVNVAAGQTLAIIGGTGSGKSTILNLNMLLIILFKVNVIFKLKQIMMVLK